MGKIKWVITKPPVKKPMTAISDGHCKSDNPLMACPEVQPPAYLLPKPTKMPPIANIKNPFKVNTDSQLNNSAGCRLDGGEKPRSCKS